MTDHLNKLDFIIKKGIDLAFEHGPRFIGALIVLIAGLYIAKIIEKISGRMMRKSKVEESLLYFIKGLIGTLLKMLVIVSFLGMIGVEMTSFVAILGALGLAVGMALSGTLQNFAGGVIILLFKPFKVGDLIEGNGHLGRVKEIRIFVTVLLTPENKTIIIPNGPLSNNDIVNYNTEGKIRVDLLMGISYNASIKDARRVLLEVMNKHPKVLQNPAPFVGVYELGDHAVNLAVRPYSLPQDYWEVYFDVYESGKEALDAANIEISFPQMDVHVKEMPK
ncbi:MAG: mechanosensitive ion channel protein MscS [Flavobacteriales bacterium]|nr:mechanosensitive ion channel protein MscS [Flavobacteriales bacterium]|tara:strand:- start:2796 stop:3629 length:834 start_codon:yes stop_codon:yes gene_type:complete